MKTGAIGKSRKAIAFISAITLVTGLTTSCSSSGSQTDTSSKETTLTEEPTETSTEAVSDDEEKKTSSYFGIQPLSNIFTADYISSNFSVDIDDSLEAPTEVPAIEPDSEEAEFVGVKEDSTVTEDEETAEDSYVEFEEEAIEDVYVYDGPVLSAWTGTVEGPSGTETYYNLDMTGVVSIMRGIGNYDDYWIRADGVKMLGDYVMVAADLSIRPRGSLIETSLGTGIVCDTGGFTAYNQYQLDIAVTW